MKKLFFISLFSLIVSNCEAKDPLEIVKNETIKNSNLTWGQAAEQFSYCKEGTKKWELVENGEENSKNSKGIFIKANFTCDLNDESVAIYNKALEKVSNLKGANQKNLVNDLVNSSQEIADANRKLLKERRKSLQGLDDKTIDELAIKWQESFESGTLPQLYEQNSTLKAINEEFPIMNDGAFSALARNLKEIRQRTNGLEKELESPLYQATVASQMKYILDLRYSTNKDRIQGQGGNKISAYEYLTYLVKDEKKKAYNNNNADYFTNNKNPIYMISCASSDTPAEFIDFEICQW